MKANNVQFWAYLDTLIKNSKIIIDRPRGSSHPTFKHFTYPIDYGYLEGTKSMDGSGVDIWVGTDPARQLDAIIATVDLMKKDTEVKLLLGCTEQEKLTIYHVHNDTEYMKGILIQRN